jgi:DNA-binding transcriptional MerR regulator
MAYNEQAIYLLQKAENILERVEAIKTALSLGMSLQEIESFLDWLDSNHKAPVHNTSLPPLEQKQ